MSNWKDALKGSLSNAMNSRRRQDVVKLVGTKIQLQLLTPLIPVYIRECKQVICVIPEKVGNLTIDDCHDCTIEVNGVIGSVEVMHSMNVKVVSKSNNYPTALVDMSANIEFVINDEGLPFNMMCAQCRDVSVYDGPMPAAGSQPQSGRVRSYAVRDALDFFEDGNPVQHKYNLTRSSLDNSISIIADEA